MHVEKYVTININSEDLKKQIRKKINEESKAKTKRRRRCHCLKINTENQFLVKSI